MRKSRLLGTVCAAILFVFTVNAYSATLWDQPLDSSLSGKASNFSTEITTNAQTAESFLLTQESTIESISWAGYYFTPQTVTNPVYFKIRFFNDDGGTPGTPMDSFFQEYDVNVNAVATGDSGVQAGAGPVFSYTYSLPSLTLGPGTYWVSIVEADTRTPAFNPNEWLWSRSDPLGVGDHANRSGDLDSWSLSVAQGNIAMTLTGTATIPPTASFTFEPPDPVSGELITFDASSSSDADGQIIQYQWDFDSDGVIDIEGDFSTASVVTHTYTERVGQFFARLTVTDDEGLTTSKQESIWVGICADRLNQQAFARAPWKIPFPNVDPVFWDVFRSHSLWTLEAESGQKLEVRWEPIHYELIYTGTGGTPTGRIGQCHYEYGVNEAYYYAPDVNGNGTPDYFALIKWNSIDGYEDDDPDGNNPPPPNGLLDVIAYTYDACANDLKKVLNLHVYPPCAPPPNHRISDLPNYTDFCADPPWALAEPPQVIDPPLGPITEAGFDALLAEQATIPTSDIQMARIERELCDIDRSGACDGADVAIVDAAIGLCVPDVQYLVDADVELDGCITEFDIQTLFPWLAGDLNGNRTVDRADFTAFLTTFGLCEGVGGFNAQADYDTDGCITFVDYQTWYGFFLNQ